MYKETMRPAWVEVNLNNLEYNVNSIKKHVGEGVELVGVVKADGYGCGAVRVSEKLRSLGVHWFATASLGEAVQLKTHGFTYDEVIILGLSSAINAEEIVRYDVIPAFDSYEFAKALSEEGKRQGKVARGIIAFDTGMGRIGYRPDDDYVSEIKKMDELENFEYIGMFSHMSDADNTDKEYSYYQLDNYKTFVDTLEQNGIDMKVKSFSNSASVIDLPETYYTHIRPGIILYGHYSMDELNKDKVPIKKVMQVKANIMKIKEVDEGDSVGYGRRFRAGRRSKIATCNVGYADGYPRPWSQHARVIVNGVYAPVAGNICMDQFMIDVTDVPDVKVGDEVILMGSCGDLEITAEEIGQATGTIHNEIIAAFGQRLPRVYIGD